MSTQKILKVGNSLGVTLPSSLVRSLSLKPGDSVQVSVDNSNILSVSFPESHQLSLLQSRSAVSPKTTPHSSV